MENIARLSTTKPSGSIPGIAEIDMEQVRGALARVKAEASETAEVFEQETVPATNALTTAAKNLDEAVSTTAERVREWKAAQVEANRAGADLEAQVRGQVIPTLDDLIA